MSQNTWHKSDRHDKKWRKEASFAVLEYGDRGSVLEVIGSFISKEDRDRAIADHNACRNLTDPAAAMEKVREELGLACDKMVGNPECPIAALVSKGEHVCKDCHIHKALAALGEEV